MFMYKTLLNIKPLKTRFTGIFSDNGLRIHKKGISVREQTFDENEAFF